MQLFLPAFESVPDPGAENSRRDLVEILSIAFLAVLCGAQHCSDIAKGGHYCIALKATRSRYCRMRVRAWRKRTS